MPAPIVGAMAETRVLVVSDSHLSQRTPEAVDNWRAVAAYAAEAQPDHVIHCGDVTADAPHHPEDLLLARSSFGLTGARVHAVPGNHDIGDTAHPGMPAEGVVTTKRLVGYQRELGLDRWSLDIPGWPLIGLNALLLGSGLGEEDDQWRWLGAVIPRHRPIVLFVHKPLVPPPDHAEDTNLGRYVAPTARDRLLEVLAARPGSVVLSGHVHQFADHVIDGVRHVWAPTTWAVIPDRIQPVLGRKACGVVELGLDEDGAVDVALRIPPGVAQQYLVDDIPDPYGIAVH